jgi:hypothetical protein
MLNLPMNKLILLAFLVISSFSYSQIDIAKERTAMHKKFIRSIEYRDVRWEYEYAIYGDQSINDYRLRVKLGWTLGKIENLKTDIPDLLNHEQYAEKTQYNSDYESPIDITQTPGSEWQRQAKMAVILYDYFVEQSDSVSALFVLKVKAKSNYVLDNEEALIADLELLLQQLDKDSKEWAEMERELMLRRLKRGDADLDEDFFISRYWKSNDIDELRPIIMKLANDKNYADVLKFKDFVVADSAYFLKAVMADCALMAGDTATGKWIYDDFKIRMSKEYSRGRYSLELGSVTYMLDFNSVSKIADFYSESDPEYACELYEGIVLGMSHSNHDRTTIESNLNKLVAYSDEEKVKKLQFQITDIEKQKEIVLTEAKSKSQLCE